MKKIVIISASPRKNGNTAQMVNEFTNVAQPAGHQIDLFDAAQLNMKGCIACGKCFTNEKWPCTFEHKFAPLSKAILDCDMIIFAMPVYWYSMPGQFKTLFDHFYAFYNGKQDLSGKEYAVFSAAEDMSNTVFEGITIPLRKSMNMLNITNVKNFFSPGTFEVGDIRLPEHVKILEDIKKWAKSLK